MDLATIIGNLLDTMNYYNAVTIFRVRVGLKTGVMLSLKETGKQFHCTPSNVQQKESRVMRGLRHHYRSRYLKPFLPSSLQWRCAIARHELFTKLSALYPEKVALTVSLRVHDNELHEALKSTEAAIKFSCGTNIRWCEHCGKPLPPGWDFCDVHCRAKWNIITVCCDTCGKLFQRHTGHIVRKMHDGTIKGLQRCYCSHECRDNRGAGQLNFTRKAKMNPVSDL
jgi:hypothetical protein